MPQETPGPPLFYAVFAATAVAAAAVAAAVTAQTSENEGCVDGRSRVAQAGGQTDLDQGQQMRRDPSAEVDGCRRPRSALQFVPKRNEGRKKGVMCLSRHGYGSARVQIPNKIILN